MLKLLGLACIVGASSGVGFGYARAVGRRQKQLQSLIAALSVMESEIRYRMTPLSELFTQLANSSDGAVGELFRSLSDGLAENRCANVYILMKNALTAKALALSAETRQAMLSLSSSMGRLDVEGQCRSISMMRQRLSQELAALDADGKSRAASYRTIGICTGLAAAVILV